MNFIVNKHFTKDTEEYRKAQLYVWNAFAGFSITFVMIILTFYNPVYGKVSYLPISVTALASLVIMYYTGNLKLCVDITCASLSLAFIKPILMTGGVHSQIFIWLILPSIFALTLGDMKRGVFWTVVAILVRVVIYKMDNDILAAKIVTANKLACLINSIFFACTILAMMFAYEYIKTKQQKTIQKQLKILLEQQDDNLSMIQQLQKIEQALTLSNNELKSFAFAAAHDLKEHIRLIGMHVQVIRKKLSSQIDIQTQEHMTFVMSGVKRMEKLLVNLVEHEQVGNKLEEKKKLNLEEICEFLFKKIKNKLPEVVINFKVNNLPKIVYYQKEVALLFEHLLDNAVKFRRNDVPLDISIDCLESNHNYVFKVADNGIGIEKDYHERVFDLFSRIHNRRDYEGSGIGLATCKKIVTNLNGRIWLENTEGGGTTVYFSIPQSNLAEIPTIGLEITNKAA